MKNKRIIFIAGFIFVFILLYFMFYYFLSNKDNPPVSNKSYCSDEQRNVDVCMEIFSPVCGYYLEDCNSLNCKKTFSNSCFTCLDKNVLFSVDGEC